VTQDSPAATAGLKAGDVITSINGRSVTGSGDLMRELGDLTGEITIGILRDRKEMTLKTVLKAGSGVL
jgi:serine protease Do